MDEVSTYTRIPVRMNLFCLSDSPPYKIEYSPVEVSCWKCGLTAMVKELSHIVNFEYNLGTLVHKPLEFLWKFKCPVCGSIDVFALQFECLPTALLRKCVERHDPFVGI